jgi:hypothetical protein
VRRLLPLLALACGAPVVESVDLGTLEQAIYMPIGYGQSAIKGMRCTTPFQGGECTVPDVRAVHMWFKPSTCGIYEAAVVVDSLLWFEAQLDWNGWAHTLYTQDTFPWPIQQGHPITPVGSLIIKCGTSVPGSLAEVAISDFDNHSTQYGTLKQYRHSTLTFGTDAIEKYTSFTLGDANAKFWSLANIMRHELGHQMGLGHTGSHIPAQLLDNTWPLLPGSPATLGPLELLTEEQDMIWCYNPNSGTGDACN